MDPCQGAVRRLHRTVDRGRVLVRPFGAGRARAGLHLPHRPRHALFARQVALQDLYRGLHRPEGQEVGLRGVLFPYRTLRRFAGVVQHALGGTVLPRTDGAAFGARGDSRQRGRDRRGHRACPRLPALPGQQPQTGSHGIPGRQRVVRHAEAEGFLPRKARHRGVPARG